MSSDTSHRQSDTFRPSVLVSSCISFEHCRWNGDIIASPYVEKMKRYIDFITVCPERDIGLGVPRKPLKLVSVADKIKMLQYESKVDITQEMHTYVENFIRRLRKVDGIILKERSPSCGISNVNIYSTEEKGAAVQKKGSGLFGEALISAFPLLPRASEGHLYNFALREHFYTQVFTLARFRSTRSTPLINNLVEFHTRHKLILMSYHQTIMRQLGKLVANHKNRDIVSILNDYYDLLCRALVRPPRIQSPINVLMHALGYFSEKVTANEKKFFLEQLELYRQKKIPVSVCNAIMKSWIVRFDEGYLSSQYFFNPYPEELIELSNSGK